MGTHGFSQFFDRFLSTGFGVLPPPLWSVILLLLAISFALLLHRLCLNTFNRLLTVGQRDWTFLRIFVNTTTGPTRLAFLIFAVSLVLPWTSFPPHFTERANQFLLVAFTVLVGWSAMSAAEIASTLYLKRFNTEVDDNLLARKHVTQVRILKRAVNTLLGVLTIGAALMTFDSVRQYGVSLFASAGAASLVVGLAARPLLTNLIAGVQIAITQPIRLEDAVIVENEWGWIEEINGTYVVIRLWDWRRLVVPLAYFLEKPFQNWTRESGSLIGSVFVYADYTVPVEAVRAELTKIAEASTLWDKHVVNLQVSDANNTVVELRALVSARTAPQAWDLRCEVREKLIAFLQREYPTALPQHRITFDKMPNLLEGLEKFSRGSTPEGYLSDAERRPERAA